MLRFSYAVSTETLERALERLGRVLPELAADQADQAHGANVADGAREAGGKRA